MTSRHNRAMFDLFRQFNPTQTAITRTNGIYGCNLNRMNAHIEAYGSGKAVMVMMSFFCHWHWWEGVFNSSRRIVVCT